MAHWDIDGVVDLACVVAVVAEVGEVAAAHFEGMTIWDFESRLTSVKIGVVCTVSSGNALAALAV